MFNILKNNINPVIFLSDLISGVQVDLTCADSEGV